MWKPSRTGGLSPLWSKNTLNKKVLLDFFQKIAESRGRAFGRAPQGAKFPYQSLRRVRVSPRARGDRGRRPLDPCDF